MPLIGHELVYMQIGNKSIEKQAVFTVFTLK